MTPLTYRDGWYLLALAAGVTGIVLALLGWAGRRFSLAALGVGAMLPVVVAALAAAIAAALAAISLQGPALAGVLAVGIAAVRSRPPAREAPTVRGAGRRFAGVLARVGVILLALIAFAFLVPLVEGTTQAMSLRAGGAIAVLVAVTLLCILPALAALGEPNRWWAPAAAVTLALVLVGIGILRAGRSADRPVHSTLLYALDREAGTAVWATYEDAGFAWVEQRLGPFAAEDSLAGLYVPGPYRTAPAHIVPVPPPTVELERSWTEAGMRIARVAVTSEVGAEIVSVSVPAGERAVIRGLNGRSFAPAPAPGRGAAVTHVTHQGVPLSGLSFDVQLSEAAGELTLKVVEHHLRAPELVGGEAFRRPPYLMPNPNVWSDRALLRTVARVPLGAGADPWR